MNSQPEPRRHWIMAPLMVGVALSPLNVVFTSVALPTMRTDFGVTIEQATWIGTAYFIPSVAFMPLQGYLGDRWGARRVYTAGLLLLSTGSFLAMFAPGFQLLLGARILQGIGWSALYPLALVMIRRYFPAGRQGEMVGLWESAVGLTTIIAPLVAGVLVQAIGWHALFGLMGLVALAGAVMTIAAVPQLSRAAAGASQRFDWTGVLQLTLVFILGLVGVTRRNWLILGAGLLVALLWWWRARGMDAPFVRPALFGNRRFVSASLAANLRMLTAVAALTALPLFFEDVQGLTPTAVGSLMVIYSLFLFLGSWPGGRWSDRAGAQVPGAVGYVCMIVGLLLLLGMDVTLSVPLVALALAVRGIGAGVSQAPYAKAAVEAVPAAQRQVAAGLYGTIRYSGLALGTALVGIFLQSRLATYDALAGGAAALPAYRELWLVLASLTVVGLGFTWLMGNEKPAVVPVQP